MAAMSLEQILERIQELKTEAEEKDEVIRVQQGQINELESKLQEQEAQCRLLEEQVEALNASAGQAEDLMLKLSEVLA